MIDMDEDYENWASEKIHTLTKENYHLSQRVAELETVLLECYWELHRVYDGDCGAETVQAVMAKIDEVLK